MYPPRLPRHRRKKKKHQDHMPMDSARGIETSMKASSDDYRELIKWVMLT
jgi:hypothetical protein